MLTLIKNAQVYAPQSLGKKDILIVGEKIQAIEDSINIQSDHLQVIDASNQIAVPGFVDSLVHITGGGGEGGFITRTPEVNLSDLTSAGITTAVAALGTDSVTRSLTGMLAKAKELNQLGLTCHIYTGSYHVPVKTLTQGIQEDLVLISECIGVGEVAIADHRGSQVDYRALASLAADSRVGGMLSGKGGIVSIHMGEGADMFFPLYKVAEKTDVPLNQFYPTHVNRNQKLLEAGFEFTRSGGVIDLTTSSNSMSFELGEIKCSIALRQFIEQGGDLSKITFSSDGHASLPEFDQSGNLISLEVGSEASLFNEVRDAILEEGIPVEDALRVITSSPADILKLKSKGYLQAGKDADINLLTKGALEIDTVIARGKQMWQGGKAVVKGLFE